MAFTIKSLGQKVDEFRRATLLHSGHEIQALLFDDDNLSDLEKDFLAEIAFDSVTKFEADLPKDDTASGLFPTEDKDTLIADGSIASVTEVSDGEFVVDLYIQNGPEFITFTSEELEGTRPKEGSRFRAWI